MNFKKQQVYCSLLSLSLLLITMFVFNYVYSRSYFRQEVPYNLSINYKKMIKKDDREVNINEIVNINQNIEITIISEYSDKSILGIYDPRMYFSNENHFILEGVTRYFSKLDYLNDIKSGIRVIYDFNNQNNPISCKEFKSENVDDFMFCIDKNSSLYRNNIKEIVNLSSLKRLGDIVYIDANNAEIYEDVVSKLSKSGYENENTFTTSIFQMFFQSLFSNANQASMILSMFSLYGIYVFVCFFHFSYNRKLIQVNFTYGGSIYSVFKKIGFKYLIYNAFFSILSIFVYILYNYLGYFTLFKISDFVSILTIHYLYTSLMYGVTYIINFKSTYTYSQEGNQYVK